jgi:hypothetical protein
MEKLEANDACIHEVLCFRSLLELLILTPQNTQGAAITRPQQQTNSYHPITSSL